LTLECFVDRYNVNTEKTVKAVRLDEAGFWVLGSEFRLSKVSIKAKG